MLPTRRIRSTQTQWTMHAQKTYALSSDAASRSASQGTGTSSACIRTPSGRGRRGASALRGRNCSGIARCTRPGDLEAVARQMDKGGSRHSCSILLPSSLWAGQCRRAAL